MPINEIFFFIVGTILISLGYKFKLRIDLIILALIVIIYATKIIFHLIYWYPKRNYLTTIDYYLFDYGLNLINPIFNLPCFLIGMYFGLIKKKKKKGINDIYESNNYYNNIINLKLSELDNKNKDEEEELKGKFDLLLNKNSINFESANEIEDNLSDLELEKPNNIKDINKKRKEDVNDINEKSNENLEKIINEGSSSKKEYNKKIKEMPFLISPFIFSNFHRKYKDRWFFTLLIIISLLIIVFFIFIQLIFIRIKIKIEEVPENEEILSKLSFISIIPDYTLNMIHLIDIEITIFLIQWGTFILYFKRIEMIRSFLNHIYWSFFIKGYYNFTLVSIPVILFILYVTETVIKFNYYNIFLYGITHLFFIFIIMIIFYSCYELPLKKLFKYFLKGKEAINSEDDDEEEDESDDDEEGEFLKDDNTKEESD